MLVTALASAAAKSDSCPVLKSSGPITITKNNQEISNLDITTKDSTPGITCKGFKNVVIKNVRVTHYPQGNDATKSKSGSRRLLSENRPAVSTEDFELAVPPPPPGSSTAAYSRGIQFDTCDDITIENVRVQLVDFESGAFESYNNFNIIGTNSDRPVIKSVILSGGSSGVWISDAKNSHLSNWAVYNVHGPFPRGQCHQCARCTEPVTENFICKNQYEYSWPEDLISMWRSPNATVRNGLLAGNNANTGTGTMFEQSALLDNSWGLGQNLQAYKIGGCCFSTYGGTRITWDNVQCKDNHCTSEGGRPSSLGSQMFYAGYENPGGIDNCCASSDISITGNWYNSCALGSDYKPPSDTWIPGKVLGVSTMNPDAWVKKDLTMEDFTPKAPIELELCFTIDGKEYKASTVTQENVGLFGDGSVSYSATKAATTELSAVAPTGTLNTAQQQTAPLGTAANGGIQPGKGSSPEGNEQYPGLHSVLSVVGIVGLLALVVGAMIRRTTAKTEYTSISASDDISHGVVLEARSV